MQRRFIMLPADWFTDEKIISVPPAARVLFLGMVTMSFNQSSYGRVSNQQMPLCIPGRVKLAPLIDALVAANLVVTDPQQDAVWILNGPYWGLNEAPTGPQPDPNSGRTAGQDTGVSARTEPGVPRARAREERKKERKKENHPIPSGIGSDGSATRAAPRSAEDAARPAPPAGSVDDDDDDLPDDVAHLSGPELAKEMLRRGIAKSTVATGLQTRVWKYDSTRSFYPFTQTDSVAVFPDREWA